MKAALQRDLFLRGVSKEKRSMRSLEVFAHIQACIPVVPHVQNEKISVSEKSFFFLILWCQLPLDVVLGLEQCGAHQLWLLFQ
jgi:hypothetical protein